MQEDDIGRLGWHLWDLAENFDLLPGGQGRRPMSRYPKVRDTPPWLIYGGEPDCLSFANGIRTEVSLHRIHLFPNPQITVTVL